MSSIPPPSGEVAPAPSLPPVDTPPWGLWTLPAVLALGVGMWAIASVVVELFAHAAGSSLSNPTPAVSLILDLVFDGSFVAAVLYFTVVQGGARPRDFGYRRVRWTLGAATFVTAAVGYYVITAVYASLFTLHGQDKLPNELTGNHGTAALVGAAAFTCALVPIAEEFFFRGFLFGTLRRIRVTVAGRQVGTALAAVLTGLLFGLAHTGSASPQYLVPLGLLGFVLCLVRWRTGSLYPCMALHSVNNCLALGVDDLHWNALEIVGLMLASAVVIAALTGPLADRALPALDATDPAD